MAALRSLPTGVLALVGCLLVATVGGLILLWPDRSSDLKLDTSLRAPSYDAEVVALEPVQRG